MERLEILNTFFFLNTIFLLVKTDMKFRNLQNTEIANPVQAEFFQFPSKLCACL